MLEPPRIAPDELTRGVWDAVIVGGGHNGLPRPPTWRAPAARWWCWSAGPTRRRVHGRAAVRRSPRDLSPCAYLVGLLDRTAVDELGLAARLPRDARRPEPVDPVPRRPRGRPVAGPGAPRRTSAPRGRPARRRGRRRLEGCSTGVRGHSVPARYRRRGRGRRRRASSSSPPSARPRVVFEDAHRGRGGPSRARTRACGPRCTARAHRDVGGSADPGTAAIPSCVRSVIGVCGAGASWRAGWGGCPPALAAAATEAGAVLAVDAPVASVLARRGVVLESGSGSGAAPSSPTPIRSASWRCCRRARRVRRPRRRVADRLAGREAQRAPGPPADLDRRGRGRAPGAGDDLDHRRGRRDAGRRRRLPRRGRRRRLLRALRPHRLRPVDRAAGPAHAQRLRAVRALRRRHRRGGRARCSTRSPSTRRTSATASPSSRSSRRTTSRRASG